MAPALGPAVLQEFAFLHRIVPRPEARLLRTNAQEHPTTSNVVPRPLAEPATRATAVSHRRAAQETPNRTSVLDPQTSNAACLPGAEAATTLHSPAQAPGARR